MNEPTIERLGRFFVVGCPQFGDPKEMCPGLAWERLQERKLNRPIDSPYEFEIGLKVYPPVFPDNGGQFYCMAGIPLETLPSPLPLGYFAAEMPANVYAVFDVPSLDELEQAFNSIYQDWLPNSDFIASHGYDFEKFWPAPEFRVQIWVPVSNKDK